MTFTETISQKLGPLPVWTWGTIAGAGVLGWIYWQQMTTASAPAVAAPVYVPADSGALDGAFYSARNGSGVSAPEQLAESNSTWRTTVSAILSGKGFAPIDIQNALSRYLNGQPLSDTDTEIVNQALTAKGLPPDGAAAPTPAEYVRFIRDSAGKIFGVAYNGATRTLTPAEYAALGNPALAVDSYKPVTTPAPVEPAPEPATHTSRHRHRRNDSRDAQDDSGDSGDTSWTVDPGDTLGSIARATGTAWQAIYDLNRDKLSNPNLIRPGQVLTLPS